MNRNLDCGHSKHGEKFMEFFAGENAAGFFAAFRMTGIVNRLICRTGVLGQGRTRTGSEQRVKKRSSMMFADYL
jgi:hypothetical protein